MIVKFENIELHNFKQPWSLYPYANFLHYGLTRKIFSVFKINKAVFTKYSDSIQLCDEKLEKSDVPELLNFCKTSKIKMICGPSKQLSYILIYMKNKEIHKGCILEIGECEKVEPNFKKALKESEFRSIADLVCEVNLKENPNYYQPEEYFHQIYNRFIEKYTNSYYATDGNQIIASLSTYAETNDYAVIGGLVVKEDYRKKHIGSSLFKNVVNHLINNNKKVFLFCYNKEIYKFYKKYANKEFQYSKMYL